MPTSTMEVGWEELDSPPLPPPASATAFGARKAPELLGIALAGARPSSCPYLHEADFGFDLPEAPPALQLPPEIKKDFHETKEGFIALGEADPLSPFASFLEEPNDAPLSPSGTKPPRRLGGWLLLERQTRLRTTRIAQAVAGGLAEAVFWRKVYVELSASWSELRCWQAPPIPKEDDSPVKENLQPVLAVPLAELDEVSVAKQCIALHLRGQRNLICLQASSKRDAERWGAAIRAAGARALGAELPKGWDVRAMLCSGSSGAVRMVIKEQLPETANEPVQRLLDHCFVCKTTKDRRGLEVPMRMESCGVVRVQNGAAWIEYQRARARVAASAAADAAAQSRSDGSSSSGGFVPHAAEVVSAETITPPVLTATIPDPELFDLLGELDAGANEQWLFHGTTASAVQGISDREFRMDLAGCHRGTMYGRAVYLAECSSKADEYAEEDEEGYCWMLLCRAVLGRVLINREVKPSPDLPEICRLEGYDSVCGDRWRAVGTFREFVLYEARQAYPAFIIRYRRWSEATLCKALRESTECDEDALLRRLVPYIAHLAVDYPDTSVRYRLTLLLGAMSKQVVSPLTGGLSSPSHRARRACVRVLMSLAEQSATVIECLGDLERRQWGNAPPAVAAAVPALIRCLLEDTDPIVRRDAAVTLEKLDDYAVSAAGALVQLLHDENDEVRAAAASALGQMGSASLDAVPILVEISEDPSGLVRTAAVTTLGRLGTHIPAAALPALTRRLADDQSEVRCAAATALGRLSWHAAPAVEELGNKLRDTEKEVRAAAAKALGHLGAHAGPAVPALAACLKDEAPGVRFAAASALGLLGPRAMAAVGQVSQSLSDPDSHVRQAAATSLGRLGAKAAASHSVAALAKRGLVDSSVDVRIAAAGALTDLVRLGHAEAHTEMVTHAMGVRLKDSEPKVRVAAAYCLQLLKGNSPTADVKRFKSSESEASDDPHLAKEVFQWRRTEKQMRSIREAFARVRELGTLA